jgi:AcrR family transcriptional regulator
MPKTARSNHRDFEAKVQHILRHAARVFAEKGYEGASIRDISRLSGVSLAGLYYYCKSKQRLLYLIQFYAFTNILRRLEDRLRPLSDSERRLRALIQNHLEYFLEHPVEMKVLSHEDDVLEGSYRREVAAIKRRYYEIARSIFEELRKASRVRPIEPRLAVLSLFGMMNWVYTWHNPRIDPGAASLAETMGAIFLGGVSTNHRRAGAKSPGSVPAAVASALEVAG